MRQSLLLLAAFWLGSLTAQAPPEITLTQISPREWVDLKKISFVQMPIFTSPPPGCLDCQTRWGGSFVVDGHETPFLAVADDTMRKLVEGR